MMLNFRVNQRLFYSLASGDAPSPCRALAATRAAPRPRHGRIFTRTHDELDLGRLTDHQRQTVFNAFGPDKEMQLYGRGIRRRLAPMFGNDRRRLELAYSLMFSLPGTPVMRYGDEIGMGDDLSLPERYAARTPMQWSSEPHGGFSTAHRIIRKVVDDPIYGYLNVNVADQRRDPHSLLNWMERVIRMRRECPEISWGDWKALNVRNDHVLALRVRLGQPHQRLPAQFRSEAVRGAAARRCAARRRARQSARAERKPRRRERTPYDRTGALGVPMVPGRFATTCSTRHATFEAKRQAMDTPRQSRASI